MDDFINYFMRPGVLIIALIVYVIVLMLRTVVEAIFPVLKKAAGSMSAAPMYTTKRAMWWNEVGLHILPPIIGGIFGFIHSSFLQGPLFSWDAVMFDCGVGWFSGTLYKGVMQSLSAKLGVSMDPMPTSVFPTIPAGGVSNPTTKP